MNITFIEDTIKEGIDYDNYIYAICECTQVGQALRVERPDQTGYIRFNCPRCGKELGLVNQKNST